MKRIVAMILILTVFAGFTACAQKSEPILEPVKLYYRRVEFTYGASDSVIGSEVRDATPYNGDTIKLLNDYMKGSQSDNLARTFPTGVSLLAMTVEGDTADLVLSAQMSHLKGIDLIIACACLTKTTMELTGVKTVVLHTKRQLLNGISKIVMDESCLLLLDENVNPAD